MMKRTSTIQESSVDPLACFQCNLDGKLTAQRELAVVTLNRNSRLLREVRAAMDRIDDGSYGFCENCEEAIAPRRLDAVPWARYCVQCQDSLDRGPNPVTGLARRIPIAA